MSLAHRVGMVVTIALAIKSGRIPMARAMTLPDIHGRQDTAIATSAVPATSAIPAPTADPTPLLSSAIVAMSSPAPVAVAAPSSASAVTSITVIPTTTPIAASAVVTSTIVPTSLAISTIMTSSVSSILASISANSTTGTISTNSTATSTQHALATTLAEELESPLPKPNYAPGGMAFILPAFVIVGLIFIIWLIHKTKEYIWKLREAEEAADKQSPDPAAGAAAIAASKLPAVAKAGGGMGGKWRKKGWKELGDHESDEDAWAIREKRGVSDKYSRVGEWQGSRKYRSRDRGGRVDSRDEGHEYGHDHRDGGERGRYGRLDVHDHDDAHQHRREPERRPSRRHREHDYNPDRSRPPSRSVRPASPVPSHAPSRALSRKEKKDRAEEWIRNEKEYNGGRHHNAERRESHREETGKGKEKERTHDAYEERYERKYIDTQQFNLMPPGQIPKEKEKLDVQLGPPAFQAAVSGTSVGVATAIISAKTTPEVITSPTKALQRTKTSRKPSPETPTSTSAPAHEDVPAYMRARAVSPPPLLSPPLNPNLFFHTGPATQLVPLSTYDSATDLESMISAQPSPLPGVGDVGDHGKMPSIPSTADKLERSATAGPGRSVRRVEKPTNSQAVSRTPTRTKSNDTPTAGNRTEALRTPVRRGTDGAKNTTPTGRTTPTIKLIDRAGSVRGGETPVLGKTSGLTPKKYSKRLAPAPTPSSTPESTRRVRAQRKDQKIRGKVDEILKESWSERAVVSPVDVVDGEDEDEEVAEKEDVVESSQAVKIMKGEVELAQAAVATSPPPKATTNTSATPVSTPVKRPTPDPRPVSPWKTGGTIPGVDSEDIRKLQGIDQRMALMKQLEERVKR